MAPAAKLRSQGISGWRLPTIRTVSRAKMGSTTPDRAPIQKDLARLSPSWRRGRAMAAPSGKFWMPIPRARATAAVSWAGVSPWEASAKEMPTAIPSGMLWSVTARTSMVVLRSWLLGPSGWPLLRWRWGMIWSRASRNKTPIQKPVTAGRNAHFPNSADRSMAGISRLQMDAAVMTPAAKPVRPRWIPSDKSLLRKNTHAAPKVVPRKGSSRP